ncbi:hypothetical protein ACH4TV_14980 [Streptomyces sp. NPDC020898]|uniref:hypothetical protein n=1 Tax=Streptomyces sp. NPDC020898 TaxID=3365101 RepID=UPI00379CEE5B
MDTRERYQPNQYEGLREVLKKVRLKYSPGSFRGETELKRVVGYLNAGLSLLFGDGKEVPVAPHKFSVEALTKKAQIDTGTGSPTDFYILWRGVDDCAVDILHYSVWVGHWKAHFKVASDGKSTLSKPGSGLSHAIHEVAYNDFCVSIKSAQISLISSCFVAGNPDVGEAASRVYAEIHRNWKEVYSSILKLHRLRLRDGMKIGQLTDILTAQADGLVALMKSNPNARVVDHEKRRTLLGYAILAIVAGAVEKNDPQKPETSVVSIVDGLLR